MNLLAPPHYLARHGAKVPTIDRSLSSIAYATASPPSQPRRYPRVHAVWEGIRPERAQPVDQAPPPPAAERRQPPIALPTVSSVRDDHTDEAECVDAT